MSSVLDISSMYDTYSSQLGNVSSTAATQKIGNVTDESSDEELMDACKSFEAYFVQKMIEEAKKTLDNEDEKGEYTKMFADSMNEQLANTITESGQVGLAKQLYDNIKTQYNL